ncbi:MFS transporter [Pseudomonas aeruginosa]
MRSPRESGPTRQQDLGVAQLGWLAAAVFVVSAGYGALMPLIPDWLRPLMGDADPAALARHVGYLSGIYTAGILLGAPLWGMLADRLGRARVLLVGLIGYVASLLPLLRPESLGVVGIYALRCAARRAFLWPRSCRWCRRSSRSTPQNRFAPGALHGWVRCRCSGSCSAPA